MITESVSLGRIASEMRSRDRDIVAYIEDVCERIEQLNPKIRAFVDEENRIRRLRSATESLHAASREDRPPLFGVPVGVKDIIHVDGLPTRAGSAVPPELFDGPEASVVTALRDAGAVVLGKTVTTEFAGRAPGLTRNPRNLAHTPGGSSSGSAAAVAAGLCPLALGTQTGGSVIRPAAFCGVVGFKPSFGRIPTDGVIPRSETLDHVGLFTQDIEGMVIAASVTCSQWRSLPRPDRPTLGVPEGPYLANATDAARATFEEQLAALERAGFGIERRSVFEEFDDTDRKRGHVADGELAVVHSDWFDEYAGFYRTPTAQRIRDGQSVSTKQLAEGRAVVRNRRSSLERTMDAAGIDVWVCPAAPGPAPRGITSTGDPVMNRPWTDAGMPAVTLPGSTINELPVGLQCVARHWADEALLGWADGIQAAL